LQRYIIADGFVLSVLHKVSEVLLHISQVVRFMYSVLPSEVSEKEECSPSYIEFVPRSLKPASFLRYNVQVIIQMTMSSN